MELKQFSKYTEKIKALLPYWFKMKKKPNDSVGLSFLHVFGLELDQIEDMLEYARSQYYIETADIYQQDILYKAYLPAGCNIKNIQGVYSNEDALINVDTLYDFYLIKDRDDNLNHNYNQNNVCFIDYKNKIIFVRYPYSKSTSNPCGFINIKYNNEIIKLNLVMHHVWNFFDEFGAIVGCKRLYGEKNVSFKERILDVFRYPANSTLNGLANGIARELNLREHSTWSDMSKDFVIKKNMVLLDTITVNQEQFNNFYINNKDEIILKGDINNKDKSAKVSYIKSINITPFNSHHYNNKLSNELFKSDGSPTEILISYINQIKTESSILWNDFKYDDALWIKESEDYYGNHFAFIPYRLDANIGGFTSYGLV